MARDQAPQTAAATFHLGDALKKLDKIADGSVKLIVSSPPYNIGKNYEGHQLPLDEYIVTHTAIANKLVSKLSENGSLCWQVGNHIREGELFPLDYTFYDIFHTLGLKLKNRIIWRFNFGLNADRRLSGRYETLLWFVKGEDHTFNLDAVRIPQRYPGKRHSSKKGAKAGSLSGNPKGKNPSDYWEFDAGRHFSEELVWDIPNVKANHPEKTDHRCQFPIELVERCVLALTNPNDTVLDPFVGVGTSVIAAVKHDRIGIGIEKVPAFLKIAKQRVAALKENNLPMRELGKPIYAPKQGERVAQIPKEWLSSAGVEESGGSLQNGSIEQQAPDGEEGENVQEAAVIGS